MKRKHIPQRTCIACRQVREKRDLVRVIRTPGQGVRIDPSGKQGGRGAYLCRARSCWERALADSSRLLDRALKTTLVEGERDALLSFMETIVTAGEQPVIADAPVPTSQG